MPLAAVVIIIELHQTLTSSMMPSSLAAALKLVRSSYWTRTAPSLDGRKPEIASDADNCGKL